MAVTLGSSITPDMSPEGRALSLALTKYIQKLDKIGHHSTLKYATRLDCRVFKMAVGQGAPTTNDSAEDPGQDMCFIVDTDSNDLHLVHTWSDASNFTAVKVLDCHT